MSSCKICGRPIEEWSSTKDMCHTCSFWKERFEEDAKLPPYTACMINGTHYIIGEEDSKSYFRGFGGAEFIIEFNDGTLIKTTNLWCQGEPSPEWIDKFPNNAKFVDNYKWKKLGNISYLVKE